MEWTFIIWHYLNLYVQCISFITRHFLLRKLTGAKSNFESMFQKERNLKNHTKCLYRWEPDRRSNVFVGQPAHLFAVAYITEISLNVTLNTFKKAYTWLYISYFTNQYTCIVLHSIVEAPQCPGLWTSLSTFQDSWYVYWIAYIFTVYRENSAPVLFEHFCPIWVGRI